MTIPVVIDGGARLEAYGRLHLKKQYVVTSSNCRGRRSKWRRSMPRGVCQAAAAPAAAGGGGAALAPGGEDLTLGSPGRVSESRVC